MDVLIQSLKSLIAAVKARDFAQIATSAGAILSRVGVLLSLSQGQTVTFAVHPALHAELDACCAELDACCGELKGLKADPNAAPGMDATEIIAIVEAVISLIDFIRKRRQG